MWELVAKTRGDLDGVIGFEVSVSFTSLIHTGLTRVDHERTT